MVWFGQASIIVSFVQIVLAHRYVLAIDRNESFATGYTSMRCMNLATPSNIYLELFIGDRVLTTDSLDRFNDILPFHGSGEDNMVLKLCVHFQASESGIPDFEEGIHTSKHFQVFTDKSKQYIESSGGQINQDGSNLVHVGFKQVPSDIPWRKWQSDSEITIVDNSSIAGHHSEIDSLETALDLPSDSGSQLTAPFNSTTMVYLNCLVDSVANASACAASTSPPSTLTGKCNIRSAVDYCTSTWNHTTANKCVINFPFEEAMYLKPSLGEIIVAALGGFLVLEGNNCTIAPVPGALTSSRFLFTRVSNKLFTSLHLLVRNLTLDSFGDISLDGGALHARGLASVTIAHVTFRNNMADNGGNIY